MKHHKRESALDLRQLRHMLAVLETGSLAKAAKQLHLSQPALTKSIQRLEEQLGVELFIRDVRGMHPTEYATLLRTYAQSAHVGMTQAITSINALKNGTEGLITIAGPGIVTSELFPEVISRLTTARPKLQIRITSQNQALVTALLEGKYDAVVTVLYNELPRFGLVRHRLFDDRLVVITRPGHPLTRISKVTPFDLQRCTWIFAEADTLHRRRLERYFEEVDMDTPHAAIETSNHFFLKSTIMRTDYVGVIARLGVEREIKSGLLHSIEIDSPFMLRPMALLLRESTAPSPAISSFIETLKDVCRERGYIPRKDAKKTDSRDKGVYRSLFNIGMRPDSRIE